jgi:kinetochore protein Spc24
MTACRLRLALYKGLGFDPVSDKNAEVDKMLVRECIVSTFHQQTSKYPHLAGSQSGDMHIVDFTTGKSDFEYSQLLWRLAGS